MKKILIFIGIVLMMSFQVFSINYDCNGDISIDKYENTNNININEDCYAIRFSYENVNDSKVIFNINNNGNNGNKPFLIYDNSEEQNYEEQNKYPYEFYFNDFENLYFKYGSDYPLITSDYINRNKFIGNNINAKIEIENSVESGQRYFISGSFSDFNDIEIYFENFGTNNELGEYRVFLNNINNVNVYVDNDDYNSNEKILLIEDDVNNIILNNNINENNDEFRIKIISFEDFMSAGLDKIYLTDYNRETFEEHFDKENIEGNGISNDIDEDFYSFETLKEIYNKKSYPFGMYAFGLLLVFISTFVARKNEGMVIKSKRHMALHLTLALMISLIVLSFTSNGFLALILSIAFSSIYSIIYYRNDMTKKIFIRFVIQTISMMLLIGISYTIYNLII